MAAVGLAAFEAYHQLWLASYANAPARETICRKHLAPVPWHVGLLEQRIA